MQLVLCKLTAVLRIMYLGRADILIYQIIGPFYFAFDPLVCLGHILQNTQTLCRGYISTYYSSEYSLRGLLYDSYVIFVVSS
jgi:hypothetical protein